MTKQSPAPHGAGRKKPMKSDAQGSVPEKARAGRPTRADLAYHRIRRRVCAHPKRDDIEQDFLRWRSPEKLANDYRIADHSSIYRHVHATGLYARRRKRVRDALENIVERAGEVQPTASEVIRAIYAHCHINDSGQWIEPPRHVFVQRIVGPSQASDSSQPQPSSPSPKTAKINRQPGTIEHDATH
jgi:hypothetical protein